MSEGIEQLPEDAKLRIQNEMGYAIRALRRHQIRAVAFDALVQGREWHITVRSNSDSTTRLQARPLTPEPGEHQLEESP